MLMSKFKLLVLTHCFPSNKDDLAGNFIYDFCQSLKEYDIDITIFTPKMEVEYNEDYVTKHIDNIIRFNWNGGSKRLAELKLSKLKDLLSLLSIFKDGTKELKRHLDKNSYDFILAPWLIPGGYYAYKVLNKYKIPYAVWGLGSDLNVYSKNRVIKRLLNKIVKKSSFPIVNSFGLYNRMVELFNKKPIILNTNRKLPEVEKVYKQDKNFRMVFVGRLEEVKGPELLINAVKLSGVKNFRLDIIGDGSLKPKLENLTKMYGLSYSIRFWGLKDKNFIANKLRESDYLVISSYSEGMPVVFWEAMQMGTPVLSTDVGDIKYYCDRYNTGRVCSVNENDLAQLISFTSNFKVLRNVLSENTKKLSEYISIEKSAEKFFNIIKGYKK